MGFSQESGYTPTSFDSIMTRVMQGLNDRWDTVYTYDNFKGSNWYKMFYPLVQELQKSEVKTSEIFTKLQQYINLVNLRISRPVNTPPGIIEKLALDGYTSSVKPMVDADAGKIHVCIDVDETDPQYPNAKDFLCNRLSQIIVGGVVPQGDQIKTITLTNGQSFDYKFYLPQRIPIKIKVTITISENNRLAIPSPDTTRQNIFNRIKSEYALGKNFEPQRYFGVSDAPWGSTVLVEWSDDDGATWKSTVHDADYRDLLTFDIGDVSLVEV